MKIAKQTYSPIIERIRFIDKAQFKLMDESGELHSLPTTPKEFLAEVLHRASTCDRCALSENRTQVVMPDGTENASIMIYSEGPGALEDAAGLPFVGPLELKGSRCSTCATSTGCYSHRILVRPTDFGRKSKPIVCNQKETGKYTLPNIFYIRSAGAILDAVISKSFGNELPRQNWINTYNKQNPNNKIEHDSIWFICNTVMCRSFNPMTNKDESPTNLYMRLCKKWFLLQWAVVQPKVIVCLGKPALETLVGGSEKASKVIPGELFETKFGMAIFQPHPAAIMRENHTESKSYGYAKLGEALKKAVEYATNN